MASGLVVHPLDPIYSETSRVLVLGTMPSPASRAARFYYGHPQNRFWRVLAALWDEPVPDGNDARTSLVMRHHIALWDVLASCTIEGASDASIANVQVNDLSRVLAATSVHTVFTTGSKAAQLYARHCAPLWPDLPHVALPSTSAANARMRLDDLVREYLLLKEAAER